MTISVFEQTVVLEIVQGRYTLDFTANGSSIYVFDPFGVETLGLSMTLKSVMLLYFSMSLLSAFLIIAAKAQGASGLTVWPLVIARATVGIWGMLLVFAMHISKTMNGEEPPYSTMYEWNRVIGGLLTVSGISIFILDIMKGGNPMNILAGIMMGLVTGIIPWLTGTDDGGITNEVNHFVILGITIQLGTLLALKNADTTEKETPSLDAYKIFLSVSIVTFAVLFILTGGKINAITFI